MTPEQADALAKRIINTWRSTPPLPEWRDTLQPLEHDHATATYTHCRNTIDHSMSIARYLGEYHGTQHRYGWQPPEDTGPLISLDEYLHRHPDDTDLFASRTRHPSSKTDA